MNKHVITYILITVISLYVFAGCTPANTNQTKPFDAQKLIDECRILVPATRYSDDEEDLKNFEIDFPRTVLDKFGKSEYYKEMTDDERKAAFKELTEILSTYSYGNATNGFMRNVSVNMLKHTVSWDIMDFGETEVVWAMPGY